MLQIPKVILINALLVIAIIGFTHQCEEDNIFSEEKTDFLNIKKGTDEYYAWRILLNYTSPNLVTEFENRVNVCKTGFIYWDFLPYATYNSSISQSYNKALDLFSKIVQTKGTSLGKLKLKTLDAYILKVINKRETDLKSPTRDKTKDAGHQNALKQWSAIEQQMIKAIKSSSK